jgi:hypothetical protein
MPNDEGVFGTPCQRRTLVLFFSAFCLRQEERTRQQARPSSRQVFVSQIGSGDLYFRGQLCSNDAEKANKDSRSWESESKKECFYRENWRHRNYLPEPAIFRHSKLTL